MILAGPDHKLGDLVRQVLGDPQIRFGRDQISSDLRTAATQSSSPAKRLALPQDALHDLRAEDFAIQVDQVDRDRAVHPQAIRP